MMQGKLTRGLPLLAAVLVGVIPMTQAIATQTDPDCIEAFDPSVDYFPNKADLSHAVNFSVSYHQSYKLVTVVEPFVGAAAQNYLLLQCGAPMPNLNGDFEATAVIEVPVQSIFSASTTHNPMFDALDAVDRVSGVASLAYTANQAILDAEEAGGLVEFAATGSIDIELVIDAMPDIFMTGGGDNPAYDVFRDASIPVIANAEWLEPSLLGRAEWIKYFSLFLNREAAATETFRAIETSFFESAAAVSGVPDDARPLVLAGSSFQGVFYASGGRSYVANAIAAAGGRYVFADNEQTSSIAHPDLELVLDAAAEALFWVNATGEYRTLDDIRSDEPRLAALAASQSGEVWNYDLIRTESGGLGFFELGVLRPDLILRDLIEIFHPGVLEGHEFVFYRPIANNPRAVQP